MELIKLSPQRSHENSIMSSINVHTVLAAKLPDFDEDLLSYIVTVVESMTLEEKRSCATLCEALAPFMLDSSYCQNDDEATTRCKAIAVAFGGSGYKSSSVTADNDTPMLLAAPVQIQQSLKIVKATYGGAVLADATNDASAGSLASNSQFHAGDIPTTQKQMRKSRKENEQLQKTLRAEALARELAAEELARARMLAIKANRTSGRQQNTGVNIERFSLPHPTGTGDLLTDETLILAPGRRYGLVGRNGAGKSTLLRRIANYQIDGLGHLRILLVDQHVEGDDSSPMQWLLRADVERTSLLEDEALLSSHLHDSAAELTKLPDHLKGVNLEAALTECYERMDAIGVHSAQQRAGVILKGLGFTDAMMGRPTNLLSGGWAMRAALAAAIFVRPNLLLLDEPTNHLDLHALVWLENWLLNDFTGMVIIVSHDQFFLNAVCTDVLELRSTLANQKKNSLEHYSGDYATFENTVAERKIAQARAFVAFEKEREKLKEFVQREGKKYDNPAHQAQRKMKLKQLEQLIEVENVEEDSSTCISIPSPYCVFDDSERLVRVALASFAFPGEEPLFSDVDFCVGPRARLAILGKNGCGKTSLLNMLVGETDATTGNVSRHMGCRITMLQQHHYRGEQLDPELNALEHMRRMPQEEGTAVGVHDLGTRQEETAQRSYLSNFGVQGWRATVPVKYLSGGQRMRVAMAVALYSRPHLLILDEPTNHLDADTVKALCVALEAFEGAIIAVSHDEAFVTQVISPEITPSKAAKVNAPLGELWIMSKRKLNRFDGGFKAYKKIIMKKVALGEDFNDV